LFRIFDGVTLGPVIDAGPVVPPGTYGPAVAVDDEGTILVARQKVRCGPSDPGCDVVASSIIVRTYSADGTPLGEAHKVAGGDRRVVSAPHVTSAGAGAFVVAWTEVERTADEFVNPRISARRVDALGTPVGAAVTTPGSADYVDVAGSGHGDFVLVWNSASREGDRVMGQRYHQLWCKRQAATLAGTRSADRLTGTDGDDVIVGRGGNDTIDGRGGRDVICGNGGDDLLVGGGQADTMDGGAGDDTIRGNATDSCTDAAGANDIFCD
jgi:hypothetical protein